MIRPDAEAVRIVEQTFHDDLTGLTFQIHSKGGRKGGAVIRILGAIPLGNREFHFDDHGVMVRKHTEQDQSKLSLPFR